MHALARCYHGVLAYRFGQDFPNGPRIAYPCFGASFVSVPFNLAPREGTMRDIRGDLQERAILVDEQIRAAAAHFDKAIQQLQTERDARIADLRAGLAIIAKFMEFEERFLHNTPPVTPASPHKTPPATPASSLLALGELFLKKLNSAGQMSKQELIDMAVMEGFFPGPDTAAQGVHPMLVSMLRSELIRQTSDGIYMPPTFSQTIKLRRVT